MKKVIFAMILVMATLSLSAQVTVYKLETTGTNPAYTVPEHIRVNFETAYPSVTLVTWEPVSEMWRATYKNNNRVTRVYYNERGDTYSLALPVINTHVPEEVVTAAIDMYGANLYDITMMKAADNSDVYQVRLLENSVPKSIWMNAAGTVVTTDVYKVKIEDNEMKIKAANDTKVKIENQ